MTDEKKEDKPITALEVATARPTPPKLPASPLGLPQQRKSGPSPLAKPTVFDGDNPNAYYTIMVYGESDSGKTHLLRTWPNPKEAFHIDSKLEENYVTLEGTGIPHVEIESWEQFALWVSDLVADLEGTTGHPTKVVCFDTLTYFERLFMIAHERSEGKDYFGAGEHGQRKGEDYLVLRSAFMRVMEQTKLIKAHRLFLCQEKLPSDFDKTPGLKRTGPDLSGKLATLVQQISTVIAHAQKTVELDGTEKRVIVPVATGAYAGRNRGGRLRKVEEPNLATIIARLSGKEEEK